MRRKRHSAEEIVNKLQMATREVTMHWGKDEAGSQLFREESRIVRWGESSEAESAPTGGGSSGVGWQYPTISASLICCESE